MIVLIATGGTALRRRSAWVVGTIGALLAAMLIDEPGPLRIAVTLTALAVFALTLRPGWSDDPAGWLGRLSRWGGTGWLRGPGGFFYLRRGAPPGREGGGVGKGVDLGGCRVL